MNTFETSPGLEQVDLQPYQRRVIQEGRELKGRIGALEAFLGGGASGASIPEQAIMYEQLSAMKKVYASLMARSMLWVKEGKLRVPPTPEEFDLPAAAQSAKEKYGNGPCESCQ